MNPEKFAPMPSNGDPLTDASPAPARAAQNQHAGTPLPACRLVLTLAAAVDLAIRMQRTATALAEAGVLKPPGRLKQRQVDLTRLVWLADWRAW
jgi:hypothetical protein